MGLTCSWAVCSLLAPSCVGLASNFKLLDLIGSVTGGIRGPSGGGNGSRGKCGGGNDGGGRKGGGCEGGGCDGGGCSGGNDGIPGASGGSEGCDGGGKNGENSTKVLDVSAHALSFVAVKPICKVGSATAEALSQCAEPTFQVVS